MRKTTLSTFFFILILTVLLCGSRSSFSAEYLGCFKDRGDPQGVAGRDLNGFVVFDRFMTVEKCINICKRRGFNYAGVQYSTQCFCGNSYGKYGRATNCDMKCGGNPNEICGGYWANSVYRVSGSSVYGSMSLKKVNLTGVWNCNDGGTYYIREIGKSVWWYGERSSNNPFWSNVAQGTKQGDIIKLNWCDVPKGKTMNRGILILRIISPNELIAIQKTGGFGGSRWTRIR